MGKALDEFLDEAEIATRGVRHFEGAIERIDAEPVGSDFDPGEILREDAATGGEGGDGRRRFPRTAGSCEQHGARAVHQRCGVRNHASLAQRDPMGMMPEGGGKFPVGQSLDIGDPYETASASEIGQIPHACLLVGRQGKSFIARPVNPVEGSRSAVSKGHSCGGFPISPFSPSDR